MKDFKSIILSILLTVPQFVSAQQISESEAKNKAQSFFAEHSSSAMRAPLRGSMNVQSDVQLAYTASSMGKNCFYVYNNGEDGGFVIIGGDEKVQSILAYSNTGHFDPNISNPNLQWWVKSTTDGISRALISQESFRTMAGDGTEVEPLITTHWGQGYPYNAMTPTVSVNDSLVNCPTGCIATAIAQVMNYHKYPDVGIGSKTIVSYTSGQRIEFTCDFDSLHFDWSNMLDTYQGDCSAEEIAAVATLMYACGYSVDMQYGLYESGAQQTDIAPAMRDHFGYNAKDATFSFETIRSELNQGFPLIYGGGQHEMVIDGYDNQGLLHLNMGWNGESDGYYAMNDMGGYASNGKIVTVHIPSEINYDNVEIDNLVYNLDNYSHTAELIRAASEVVHLEIPDSINYNNEFYQVIKIGNSAFSSEYSLKTISLPGGLEIIGDQAFLNDTLLTDFAIPSSVLDIGNGAFAGCSSLTTLGIPKSVVKLGNYLCRRCNNLSSFVIDEDNLNYYYFDGGVYSKTENTLVDVIQSTGVFHIKEGTEKIGDFACYATNLDEIIIPNTVRIIGDVAFQQNWNIKKFILPESVDQLGNIPFSGMTNLEYLYIPSKAFVQCNEFVECLKLKTIEISEENPYLCVIDNMVFSKDTTILHYCPVETPDSIFLPECTKLINNYVFMHRKMKYVDMSHILGFGDCLFSYCENLESIEIPEGTLRIPSQTFNRCYSLREITLPSTLEGIWCDAFWGCKNLMFINCNFANPFPISDSFYHSYLPISGVLTVPQDSKVNFENADGWKEFTIVEKGELPYEPRIDSLQIITSRSVLLTENDSILLSVKVFPEELQNVDVAWAQWIQWESSPRLEINENGVAKNKGKYNYQEPIELFAITMDGSKLYSSATIMLIRNDYAVPVRVILDGERVFETFAYYGVSIDEINAYVEGINTYKEGMTFNGWIFPDVKDIRDMYWASYDIIGDYIPNVYAVKYEVDGLVVGSDSVAYGSALTSRPDSIKEGYTFSGWSEIPDTMPAHDVIVTGNFSINSYLLTYKVDDVVISSDSIVYGSALTSRPDSIKEGYTFSGWSQIPATMPANNVEVTGLFSINSYILTYKLDGEVYHIDTLNYATAITALQDLTKEGYTFSGWSEIPATMPANDIEVTGSFTVKMYLLTLLVDGEIYCSDSIAYGTRLMDYLDLLIQSGIDLSQWELYDNIENITMPAHDLTVAGSITVDGIIGIEYDSRYRVYNLTGKFLGEMTDEDLKLLEPGVYIVNNRKIIVK